MSNPLFSAQQSAEQTENDKTYGRKRQSWVKAEAAFQAAQDGYEQAMKDNDQIAMKKYWDEMFFRIHSATFNMVNKRLQRKHVILEKEEIESRALDVTLSIVRTIRNKIDQGKPWKIKKLSSYCWLPSLQIFSDQLIFYDRQVSLDGLLQNEDGEDMELEISEEDGYYKNGVTYLYESDIDTVEEHKKDKDNLEDIGDRWD